MKIKVYPENCCDGDCDCGYGIIHNHLDCPICKTEYSDSEQRGDLEDDEDYIIDGYHIIECSKCNTIFITKDSPYDDDSEWSIAEDFNLIRKYKNA